MILKAVLIVLAVIVAAISSLGGLLWIMARERALNAKAVVKALDFEESATEQHAPMHIVQNED